MTARSLPSAPSRMPLVSVIVATYRREACLRVALESLIAQKYRPIEIVLVDDNAVSTWNERVQDILDEIDGPGVSLVRIRNEQNLGSAAARNVGIGACSGDYVTFLDDDDEYLPDKVRLQLSHMLEHASDFSVTDLELVTEAGLLVERRSRRHIREWDSHALMRYHLMHHLTGTDTFMFTRAYLLGLGGFPPNDVGDEFYLMENAIAGGGRFSYLERCLVRARVHSGCEGLSSGESKVAGENALHRHKRSKYSGLDEQAVAYIEMRHWAVLAFAELRRRRAARFVTCSARAVAASPSGFARMVIEALRSRRSGSGTVG